MELTCPSCHARFRIGAGQLPDSGRRVRCGRCGHTWRQRPVALAEPAAAADAARAGEPETAWREPPEAPSESEEEIEAEMAQLRRRATLRARPELAPEPARRPQRLGLLLGWLLFALVLAGLAAGAWFERAWIVARLPEAARLYELAGIEVAAPGRGLELRDVTSVRRTVEGKRVLTIAGAVVNVTDRVVEVPPLKVSITDGSGAEIASWEFAAAQPELPPNGVTTFETQTENPPGEGQLSIVFARDAP